MVASTSSESTTHRTTGTALHTSSSNTTPALLMKLLRLKVVEPLLIEIRSIDRISEIPGVMPGIHRTPVHLTVETLTSRLSLLGTACAGVVRWPHSAVRSIISTLAVNKIEVIPYR